MVPNPLAPPAADYVDHELLDDMVMALEASEDGSEMETGMDLIAADAQKFAKAFDSLSHYSDSVPQQRKALLQLPNIYYEHAAREAKRLRDLRQNRPRRSERRYDGVSSPNSMDMDEPEDDGSSTVSTEERQWELEAQTWDLLRRLLPLRYRESAPGIPQRRLQPAKFSTTSQLWEEYLESDPAAQEWKAVLESLQQTADESSPTIDDMVRDLQQKAERGDIIAYGWLHTRSAIKMRKNIHGWSGPLDPNSTDVTESHVDSNNGKTPLVTQLDPDAITRQDRKLQPQDEYFERAIWRGCYELLRRGRSLSEIRDWCVERTEVWRAMSMSALSLAREEEDQTQSGPDALATILWRRTCFALTRQGGMDDYERAVYGILSGDVSSVENICQSWDDFLFAHCNALLRDRFDNYLLKSSPREAANSIAQAFPAFHAVQLHGSDGGEGALGALGAGSTTASRVMASLENKTKGTSDASRPLKALQSAIISSTASQYIADGGYIIGRAANQNENSSLILNYGMRQPNLETAKYVEPNDHQGLRILAHVYLILLGLEELEGRPTHEIGLVQNQENVLTAYIIVLRLHQLVDFLPLYCSKLQGERSFHVLSRSISRVTDVDQRRTLLRNMKRLGMDTKEFLAWQPLSYLKEPPGPSSNTIRPKSLDIFEPGPPTLKFGRRIRADFLGEESEYSDNIDSQLIASLEWMMLEDGLWDEIFEAGVRIYKRFFLTHNLQAAKALASSVSCADIFRVKAGLALPDDADHNPAWFQEIRSGGMDVGEDFPEPDKLVTAYNFLELECLIRILDAMETVASSVQVAEEQGTNIPRSFWDNITFETNICKACMDPLMKGWLRESKNVDLEFEELRQAYLPEVVLGHISVLHYTGVNHVRDNLLECMDLAALIADRESDVADAFMEAGRMKELVESFANCSKAIAVKSGEKRAGIGSNSKKMRENGWTREIWSVRR